MMSSGWVMAAIGLIGTLLLLTNRVVPAMFILLLFGAVCSVFEGPDAVAAWLTLGNAIIAIREENNRLFPDRAITENQVAVTTGMMGLLSATLGGVPMCHGAGGMAGHVTFGARTGGAPVILGSILVVLALGFSGSIEAIFAAYPRAILGVIIFLTGAQLALGSCDFSTHKIERLITLVTAAFSMWNVGLAFVVGMTLAFLHRRGFLRL